MSNLLVSESTRNKFMRLRFLFNGFEFEMQNCLKICQNLNE